MTIAEQVLSERSVQLTALLERIARERATQTDPMVIQALDRTMPRAGAYRVVPNAEPIEIVIGPAIELESLK